MRRWPIFAVLFLLHFSLQAQERTVALPGNHPPLARAEFDAGPVAPDFPMRHMILVLQPSAAQNAELKGLTDALHNPASPEFHRWLAPEDFAARFGVSPSDLQRVTNWLTGAGFSIDEIPAGGRTIVFSGTAAQVEAAFQTSIHTYIVHGETHHANSADPRIPEEFAGLIAGAVSMHDFRKNPLHGQMRAAPEYTQSGSHYLTPSDFATIYDVAAVYSAGFKGAGQTVAVAGRANIRVSDVQTFRQQWGLPVNNPTVIVNGTDPGITSLDEEAEAYLDVEWSGAVAPLATVDFVVSASTTSTDGIDLSSQYIVSHNLAPVVSLSFGACEASLGSAERAFYSSLWQQAVAQGMTAFVAAGDSGAAGCDSPSEATATQGLAVNGLCSSVYDVCVGGTEFDENGNNSLYWSNTNNASGGSALSYIPEVAWNESGSNGGSDLWSTGGGASAYYAKPSWQSGPGVPSDSKRDVPDVSLSSATHDGYLVDILGGYYTIGGTSASTPSFAGIMALVNQKTNERQGNANTILYPLAAAQAAGGSIVFHSVAGGNNSVPGQTGFAAGPHYNQATGLGSPDALMLVNHWTASTSAPSSPSFSVSAPSSVSIGQSSRTSAAVTVAVSGGFSAAVSLSITGLPSGITAAFAPASFAAPGSGSSTLTLSSASNVAAGSYPLTIAATSGSQQKTSVLTLTVSAPFTISASPTALSIARGSSGSVTITASLGPAMSGSLTLSASSLPSGVTAAFSPASISSASGNSPSSKLTLTVSSSATPGTYSILVNAASGATVESAAISLTIASPATFTLNASPSSLTVAPGGATSTLISLTPVGGFTGTVTVSYGTLPSGITARWSDVAAGAMLTLETSAAVEGAFTITITGTSPGLSPSPTVAVTLNVRGTSAATR